MRLVVDAMCAEFGGIRTYVEHLLGQWSAVFPEDELHVVVPTGSTLPTAGHHRHELAVSRPSIVGRPLAQTTRMRRLVRRLQPDAVLATAPTTTVLALDAPMTVVILDLRHELRPEQFSAGRRLLRKVSYTRTYALAAGYLAISQRSLDDLHDLHPATVTSRVRWHTSVPTTCTSGRRLAVQARLWPSHTTATRTRTSSWTPGSCWPSGVRFPR